MFEQARPQQIVLLGVGHTNAHLVAVFAVGDSGTIAETPTPKAGVYAIRQGPILWKNLARLLAGQPLLQYAPRSNFLKLLNTGDGQALGEYLGWSFQGRWVWKVKDWIDGRFMDQFRS
jgi:NADH dehydrogenase FAD-containing subunit